MDAPQTADVIISGAGPVGLSLAIDLGQRGVSVLLLEKHPAIQPVPKGQNLTQRTMEHFCAWNSEAALKAARTVPAEFGIGGMTTYRTLLGPYRHDWLKRELVRPYYGADNERLPQYATEAVLRARVNDLPKVTLWTGWNVEDVTQDDSGVAVTATERETGASRTFCAAFGIGSDGARSVVRERAGIDQDVFDHDRKMVLLVFRSDRLHALLADHPGKSFFNVLHPELQGYWLFFGRVDLDGTFFFHAPLPPDCDHDSFDFQTFVDSAVGVAIDIEISYKGFWDCRIALALQFSAGRLFIAGDAAHNHPPYGGYGINTGFEDARNLGWKIAATLHGWGGPALLASYDAERRPVAWSTSKDFIERSIETDRTFLETFDPDKEPAAFNAAWAARSEAAADEVGAFLPNYRGSPIVAGSRDGNAGAIGVHSLAARAGYHLAPLRGEDGNTVVDGTITDFTLVVVDRPSDADLFLDAATERGMPLQVCEVSAITQRESLGATLILLRPDGFVAWAGDTVPRDIHEILRIAIGAA